MTENKLGYYEPHLTFLPKMILDKEINRFFDLALDLLCIADKKGNFLRLNNEWQKVLGFPVKEMEGKNSLSFIHPEDAGLIINACRDLVSGREISLRNRYLCTDGGYKWIEWRLSLYGEHIFGAARDITESIMKEAELIAARDRAEESDRLKTAFLQNMSHEVRTPLNAIVGFSQLLAAKEYPPGKKALFAEMITRSSSRLIGIITDVIEMSKLHSQQVTCEKTEVDLNLLFTRIINSLEKNAKDKNIALSISWDIPYKNLTVLTDKDKLKKIFTHLIDNAIKFTSHGSVNVRCRMINGDFQVEVADTGIGIAKAHQKMIFEPFRQIGTESGSSYGGNGLGLTIAKAYVDLLKGNISLESDIDRGTVVTVSLPFHTQSFDDKKCEEHIATPGRNVKTILVAEDERLNFYYLRELLCPTDNIILHAVNGHEAVSMCLSNQSVDLVLMDIKMPVMDGKTAAINIKKIRPALPIIAQTAYALENEKTSYMDVFDDYIEKPISSDSLKQKLSKYLDL